MVESLPILDRVLQTIDDRALVLPDQPVLLMVSGGSDSTALAYLTSDLSAAGRVGPLALVHVNHCLRGDASDGDAAFVRHLAEALELPYFQYDIDIAALVEQTGENLEAVARSERYAAAQEALSNFCAQLNFPTSSGRIFVAHTRNDRVENFYMRSIVGCGPGGFRSMRYINGCIVRPLLDVSRDDLRDYLRRRALDAQNDASVVLVRDKDGSLWHEDATNAHTDRFRAYVRTTMVPAALERNPRVLEVLCRTMNLIADEDDMLAEMAEHIMTSDVQWRDDETCLIKPSFAQHQQPIQRRVAFQILQRLLTAEARVESAAVEAVLNAFSPDGPRSGYVANIQGNLALSANKRGLLIEPMNSFRVRRRKDTTKFCKQPKE